MNNLYNPESLFVAGTVVNGLGGSCAETVRLVKARVRQSMEPQPNIVEFMVVDTEPRLNEPGREHLSQGEYAYLGDYNARRVLEEIDAHPHIKDWWFEKDEVVTGTIHKGARQRRPVGRLSLYVNWGEFARIFDAKSARIREIVQREKDQRRGINVQRSSLAKVYIISSLCGGTGSSIFLDVAFKVRQVLGDDADIVGIFYLPSCFLPEIQSTKQRRRIQANAYASLLELNHFMKGSDFQASFPDEPYHNGNGAKESIRLSRPFDTVYFVDRSNGKELISDLENIRHLAAQQVFLDIITPMGARYAARRANLQDLAGEKSKANGAATGQSLAFGGFATASLILPSKRLMDAASEMFGADYIRQHVLGKAYDVHHDLDQQLEVRIRNLYQTLLFEDTPVESRQEQVSDDDAFFAQVLGLGSAGSSSSTGDAINLSDVSKVVGEAYRELGETLAEDFKAHGLRGMQYIIKQLIKGIDQEATMVDQRLSTNRRQITEIKKEQGASNPKPSWLQRLLNKQGVARDEQEHNQQQQKYGTDLERLNREIQRDEQTKKALNKLINDLNLLGNALEKQNGQLETLVRTMGLIAQDILSQTVPLPHRMRHQQRADIFELATYVGEEAYSGRENGSSFNEPYWQWAPKAAIENVNVGSASAEQFARLAQDIAFNLRVDSAYENHWELKLEAIQVDELDVLEDAACKLFVNNSKTSFSILEYLDWFYKYIHHGTANGSRFSPLDPLQILNDRCSEPFLEVDKARLGTEGGNDTEPVRLLGIPVIRATDPMAEELFTDFDQSKWEDVPTGAANRIDISYSRHGYPIKVLKDLDLFKKSYLHFRDDLNDKMHPHRDWPNGMDDLLS